MKFFLLLALTVTICPVRSQIPITNQFDSGTDLVRIAFQNFQDVSPDDARRYVNYAFANYCPLREVRDWTCRFCPQTSRLIRIFSDFLWNTQGLLVIDDSRQEVIVSFRGSFNVANIFADALPIPMPLPINSTAGSVHAGFLSATNSLLEDVITSLDENILGNPALDGYRIVFTGHSLGGAMASLMVSLLRLRNHGIVNRAAVSLYTYGQPRTGNRDYANFVNEYAQNHAVARVTGGRDVVAHMFPFRGLGYLHHGTEIFNDNGNARVCENDLYEDPTCSNRNGPFYSVTDHVNMYWEPLMECLQQDLVGFLGQFIIPIRSIGLAI